MSYVADYSAPTYGTVAHPLSSVYVLGSPLSSTVVWEVGGAPAGSRGHVPIELSVLFLREGLASVRPTYLRPYISSTSLSTLTGSQPASDLPVCSLRVPVLLPHPAARLRPQIHLSLCCLLACCRTPVRRLV
jgi:hypothetical protein